MDVAWIDSRNDFLHAIGPASHFRSLIKRRLCHWEQLMDMVWQYVYGLLFGS